MRFRDLPIDGGHHRALPKLDVDVVSNCVDYYDGPLLSFAVVAGSDVICYFWDDDAQGACREYAVVRLEPGDVELLGSLGVSRATRVDHARDDDASCWMFEDVIASPIGDREVIGWTTW